MLLVSTFKVQRRSILTESLVNCSHELHVFVDASQSAMCAVAFLRAVQSETVVSFLVAKCRVAPFCANAISKLELQAAVIGLRLSMSIQSFLPYSVQNCFLWSGSSTVFQGFNGCSCLRC